MDLTDGILSKVKRTISRYRMTEPGDLIVVGVSGGPDSVCLLDILNRLSGELKISLLIAHYDHGLRPGEDEFETGLVEDLAGSMGLLFRVEKAVALKTCTTSLEEKAREARYGFLETLRGSVHAGKIALGHTCNDQAETVIMRLLRGSGLRGLSGIPPVRDSRIIRPLIEIKREEIESYVEVRGLVYAVDSSNRDTRFLRNRIRLELLPELLEYQPKLLENLGKLSDILRGEDLYLERVVKDWVDGEAEPGVDGSLNVSVATFRKLPQSLRNRTVRYLLKSVGQDLRRMDYDHILSVSGLVESDAPQCMINLPKGLVVRKAYDRLMFTPPGRGDPIGEFEYILELPGKLSLGRIGRSIQLEEVEGSVDIDMSAAGRVAYLDGDRVGYPLKVRNFRPGDRFVPLGMKGHKKVKDFFIDLKVASDVRASVPILMSRDRIVWICGYRIDDRFKVTPETQRVIKGVIT